MDICKFSALKYEYMRTKKKNENTDPITCQQKEVSRSLH